MNQQKLILTIIVAYILSIGVGYVGASAFQTTPTVSSTTPETTTEAEPTIPSEPLTEACPLNGKMYGKTAKAKWEKRRPLAVVIENHTEARPQSGTSGSDVVYEAVTEGGVTRMLNIFYCQEVKTVGPVRSARVHFINLLREWGENPLYVHVGGANCDAPTGSGCGNGAPADALGYLGKLGWNLYNDMNQFSIPYPYFYRDYDRLPGVATEHTMYSNTIKLWEYAAKNRKLTEVDEEGVRWDKGWVPWKFIDDAESAERGSISVIQYDFYDTNASEFRVRWDYDKSTNTYRRSNGSKPHKDYNTGKQLIAKNVVIIESLESPANDDYPGGHIVYKLTGTGKAHFYQNGQEITGTWSKDTLDSKMIFEDADGKEISIVRGEVWISMIPKGNTVYAGSAPPSTTNTVKTDPSDTPKATVKPKAPASE